MDQIDAAFKEEETHTKCPKWMIRVAIALVFSAIIMYALKPKATQILKYNAKAMKCEMHTDTRMMGQFILCCAVPMFFIVRKYY